MMESRYQKLKNAGLCVRCGKTRDRDGAYCSACCKKHTDENKTAKKWYAENHVCPSCRKESLYGDEKQCLACQQKHNNFQEIYRQKNRLELNKRHADGARRIYAERKAQGLCPRCGKIRPQFGFITCGLCQKKDNSTLRSKYVPHPIIPVEGKCRYCDNPVYRNYKVCQEHFDKMYGYRQLKWHPPIRKAVDE